MKSILLVTPAWERPELTRIMLEQRLRLTEAVRPLGVRCETVVIADDENLDIAEDLGHKTVGALNVLGAKFNDGYEYAVEHNYDWAFHVNSDQAFDPALIAAIAKAPTDRIVTMSHLSAVNATGERFIAYRNPVRAMQAFPLKLLRRNPRPCAEHIMSGCDRSTYEGVARANHGAKEQRVRVGPLETIQFESEVQMTGWERHVGIARNSGAREWKVPWDLLAQTYGPELIEDMQSFYEVRQHAIRGS